MSRISLRFVLALLTLLAATPARAEPIALISVNWSFRPAGLPARDSDKIYKALRAAFAEALKKNLNVADPAAVADLDLASAGQGSFQIHINSRGVAQPTREQIIAVAEGPFLETVTKFFNDLHSRELNDMRAQAEHETDTARKKSEEARDRLAQLRNNLRQITRRVDVSPESLRLAVTRLEDELERLSLDFEGQAERKKAIEAAVAEISQAAQKQMTSDRIAVELQKLVTQREADVKRIQDLAANNNVSRAEVDAAEARLSEARVRLWERQEVVARTAGGEVLTDLNKELATLSIKTVESAARLKRLHDMVNNYASAVDKIDDLEAAQTARQSADTLRLEAEAQLAERLRALRQFRPPTINFYAGK